MIGVAFAALVIRKKTSAKSLLYFGLISLCTIFLFFGMYILHGSRSAIYFTFTLFSLIATPIVISRVNITSSGRILIFSILVLGSVLSELSGLNIIGGASNQFFPAPGSLLVNISPPGSTVHFSAILAGVFLVAVMFDRLLGRKVRQGYIGSIVFPALLTYIVFFSQSRVVLLGVIFAFIAILVVKYLRVSGGIKSVVVFWIIMITLLGTIFTSEAVGEFLANRLGSGVLRTILNSDNSYTASGFSAGRSWLWIYHLNLFQQSFFGAGISSVRDLNVGDVTDFGRASASSESFITGLLAAYGWGGIFLLTLIASYFTFAAYKGELLLSIVFIFWVSVLFGASAAAPPSGFLFFLIAAVGRSKYSNQYIQISTNR